MHVLCQLHTSKSCQFVYFSSVNPSRFVDRFVPDACCVFVQRFVLPVQILCDCCTFSQLAEFFCEHWKRLEFSRASFGVCHNLSVDLIHFLLKCVWLICI